MKIFLANGSIYQPTFIAHYYGKEEGIKEEDNEEGKEASLVRLPKTPLARARGVLVLRVEAHFLADDDNAPSALRSGRDWRLGLRVSSDAV